MTRSIEEQFYLVFPLTLPFLVKRPPVILMVAIASAAIRFGLPEATMYYATVTRLDGLMLGAALAVSGWRTDRTRIALAAICAVSLTGAEPAAWSLAVITLAGVLLVASTPRALIPLAPLGRISYSLYLYHVPLSWAFGPAIGIPVAIIAAYLSTRFLEEPIRRWAAASRRLVGERQADLVVRAPRGGEAVRDDVRSGATDAHLDLGRANLFHGHEAEARLEGPAVTDGECATRAEGARCGDGQAHAVRPAAGVRAR